MTDKKESKFKVKLPKLNASKKTYDFSLSLSGMISSVGAGVLALTFFFVMGILIGRGYRPEADVPQLQEIMPSKQHGQIAGELDKPAILRPEELEYPERLMESPEKVMDQVAPDTKPEPKPAPKPEVKPTETKPEPAPVKTEVAIQSSAQTGEQVYDYIYQVASFRKAEMAEALSGKLRTAGLRTSVVSGDAKGSTWYRVQVLHKGTPASTDAMKAILAKQGVGKPLLKKKTAAQ